LARKFSNVIANLGAFQSRSDLGAVQSFNNGLTLLRTKEKIRGSKVASTTSATMTAGAAVGALPG
jgi:hypothetical protein